MAIGIKWSNSRAQPKFVAAPARTARPVRAARLLRNTALGADTLLQPLSGAVERRENAGLFTRAEDEGTSAFRLLHGPTEGVPGVAIDLYGDKVLVQSWREALDDDTKEALSEELRSMLPGTVEEVVFHLRGKAARQAGRPLHQKQRRRREEAEAEDEHTFEELGLRYRWESLRSGGDPSLFLDFRPVRRLLMEQSAGKDVLNLFAYTCGAGVAAAAGGAKSVCNVDHSATYLRVGRRNMELNSSCWEGTPPKAKYIAQDFYPAARQMAGLGFKGRASRKNNSVYKLPQRDFDIVVLDPPTLTKSPFGAVDIINDYASLAKPSILCTRPEGGLLVATNHAASVNPEEWIEAVVRCGKKCGRPIAEARVLEVEPNDDDFPPSEDMPRLLKVGLFTME